mmetsp:Transcript_11680/g.27393  ORF Transcript_11680/g.27393 Transcript_11680/m.27393 type:complete len:99 (-) Transcript_11680:9-305(-)
MPPDLNAASQQQMSVWSDAKIVELCENYFPGLDPLIRQNQVFSARNFVARSLHLKGPMGASKGTKFVLAGGRSVFEAPFSRDDTFNQPISGFLYVADY